MPLLPLVITPAFTLPLLPSLWEQHDTELRHRQSQRACHREDSVVSSFFLSPSSPVNGLPSQPPLSFLSPHCQVQPSFLHGIMVTWLYVADGHCLLQPASSFPPKAFCQGLECRRRLFFPTPQNVTCFNTQQKKEAAPLPKLRRWG